MDGERIMYHLLVLMTLSAFTFCKDSKQEKYTKHEKNQKQDKDFFRLNLNDVKNVFKIQEVRAKILRGLNMSMTLAPKLKELTYVTEKPKSIRNPVNQINRTTILSEASNSLRLDTMSFNLGSRISSSVEDVKSAILVIRFKALKKDKRLNKMKLGPEDELELTEKISNLTKNIKITEMLQKAKNQLKTEEDQRKKPTVGIPKNFKGNKQEQKYRMRQDSPPLPVKVVVRVIDETTGQRKKIYDMKVIVEKTTMMKVNLTKEVTDALQSPNHTLTVQVTCKRCKKRVQMEKVFKTPKQKNRKNGNKSRRLNPQRPFLVVTTETLDPQRSLNVMTTESSAKSIADNLSRTKRQSLAEECTLSLKSFAQSQSKFSSCCSVYLYVTFQELGLGNIVKFPRGFTYVHCLRGCGGKANYQKAKQITFNSILQIPRESCEPIQRSSLDIYYINNETRSIIPGSIDNIAGGFCNCPL